MTDERLHYIRSLNTLACLVDHTPFISLDENERVVIENQLKAPVDEFGIPRAELHVERVLGAMTTKNFVWTGKMDVHHLCTPKADFTVVRTADEGDIGSAFRGLSCHKIEQTRLMHNFGHAILELPGRPSVEVMRQALLEVGQGKQLAEIIRSHTHEQSTDDDNRTKALCLSALHRSIERMREPEVNMMPPLETLMSMDFGGLQSAVRAMVTVRRFGYRHLIHPAVRNPNGANSHMIKIAA